MKERLHYEAGFHRPTKNVRLMSDIQMEGMNSGIIETNVICTPV